MKNAPAMLLAVAGLTLSTAYAQELAATFASTSADYVQPSDATPSPDGATFYFLAIGANGPTLFQVASTGGPVSAIASGAPFVSPGGLAVSTDGRQIYVADRYAFAPGGLTGRVFVVPSTGGTPRPVPGTEGFSPRGIEVVAGGDGQDVVYFSGSNPHANQVGIYSFSAGGAPAAVFEGYPLIEPDGLTISRSGDVYVADRGDTPFTGGVFKISSGVVTRVVNSMRPGTPAGLALSFNESRLLVSTLQPYRTRAQVLTVDLRTNESSAMTDVVGENAGAGGIHRAKDKEVYAWAGVADNGKKPPHGPIYKIMDK